MKRPGSHRLPFEILYEDRDVIVIDKPAGLLTTHTRLPTRMARETQRTAENILNDYVRKGQLKSRAQVWLVHRLDRDTSGVMMFAKSRKVAEYFRSNWNDITEKMYLATVEGRMQENSGTFESNLAEDEDGYMVRSVPKGGKRARTEWKVISRGRATTLVEVRLKTGRKNQIRAHFSEAGHPVVGDVKYGAGTGGPLMLRSIRLKFALPCGKKVDVSVRSGRRGG